MQNNENSILDYSVSNKKNNETILGIDYMKHLPMAAALYAMGYLFYICIGYFISHSLFKEHTEDMKNINLIPYWSSEFINLLISWFFIGKVFSQKKAALYAIVANVFCLLLRITLIESKTFETVVIGNHNDISYSNFIFLLISVCYIVIPMGIYAFMVFKDKRVVWCMLLANFLYFSSNLTSQYISQNQIGGMFFQEGITTTLIIGIPMLILGVLNGLLLYIVSCEFLSFLSQNPYHFLDKILDFNRDRSKLQIIIVFIGIRLSIANSVFLFYSYHNYFDDYFALVNKVINFVLTLSLVYFGVWIYRKMIGEYLFGRGLLPGWIYYFSFLPFLGDLLLE
jgi:hypothetical protein